MFQSAPAIAGGRCGKFPGISDLYTPFQSAPAIAGGRCSSNCTGIGTFTRFNPRPPLLAGDAAAGSGACLYCEVSIRARHCWRAMPASVQPRSARRSFQSAPAIAGGRCPSPTEPIAMIAKFQSAPAIAGGRCRRAPSSFAARSCFNPRPPLLAGDAFVRLPLVSVLAVSIRARHCWRAMHGDLLALFQV